jgi:predicted Zn-dependent peptidase
VISRAFARCSALAGALVACGCGGASTVKFERAPLGKEARLPTPDGAFRAHPPSASHASVFSPPAIIESKLANGVCVLIVEKHDFPIITLRVRSSHAPDAAPPGVGALWARSVFRGSSDDDKGKNGEAVFRRFSAHAVEYDAFVSHEESSVEIRMLSGEVKRAVEILGETLNAAAFPEKGVKKARNAYLNLLAERAQSREAQFWDTGLELLYPAGHPYRSDYPSASTIKAVKVEDLVAYHHAVFGAGRTTIVVAGDVTPATIVPRLEKAFGWIPALPPETVAAPPRPPSPVGPKVTYSDHPADVQALVGAWWIGVPLNDPDALALDFAREILRRRLYEDLRTDNGFTYGVGAKKDWASLGAPPIALHTAVERAHVGEAVQTILREVRALSSETIGDESLAIVRDEFIDDLGAWFETTNQITTTASFLPLLGLPSNEYTTWPTRLAAIKGDELRRVARQYLSPDAVQFLIVGDEKTIRPQVEAAMKAAPPAALPEEKTPDTPSPAAPP